MHMQLIGMLETNVYEKWVTVGLGKNQYLPSNCEKKKKKGTVTLVDFRKVGIIGGGR